MTDEIREQLEAEEMAAEMNEASESKKFYELGKEFDAGIEAGIKQETTYEDKHEDHTEEKPVDIAGMAAEIRRKNQEQLREAAEKVKADRLRKYDQEDQELLAAFNAGCRRNLERAMNNAADKEIEIMGAKVVTIFANDARQKLQQGPGVVPVPQVKKQTMAGQKARTKKRTRVYHSELGSLSSWAIAITLLLGLIARLAGVA